MKYFANDHKMNTNNDLYNIIVYKEMLLASLLHLTDQVNACLFVHPTLGIMGEQCCTLKKKEQEINLRGRRYHRNNVDENMTSLLHNKANLTVVKEYS